LLSVKNTLADRAWRAAARPQCLASVTNTVLPDKNTLPALRRAGRHAARQRPFTSLFSSGTGLFYGCSRALLRTCSQYSAVGSDSEGNDPSPPPATKAAHMISDQPICARSLHTKFAVGRQNVNPSLNAASGMANQELLAHPPCSSSLPPSPRPSGSAICPHPPSSFHWSARLAVKSGGLANKSAGV